MKDNKGIRPLYYAATLLVGAAVGYWLKGCQEEKAQIEFHKVAMCDLAAMPLRSKFKGDCTIDNFERGTALRQISKKKDQLLEDLDCPAQAWTCAPDVPYDLERGVHAEFR